MVTRKFIKDEVKMLIPTDVYDADLLTDAYFNRIFDREYNVLMTDTKAIVKVEEVKLGTDYAAQNTGGVDTGDGYYVSAGSDTIANAVDLTSIPDFHELRYVIYNGQKLVHIPYDHIRDITNITSYNDVRYYYIAGDLLYVVDGDGLTVTLNYYAKPEQVTDDDTPLQIDDAFADALVWGMASRIVIPLNPQLGIYYKSEYEKMKKSYLIHNTKLHTSDIGYAVLVDF